MTLDIYSLGLGAWSLHPLREGIHTRWKCWSDAEVTSDRLRRMHKY
ncbi:hypothetical protein [Coleofasciculus sp. H7-2]